MSNSEEVVAEGILQRFNLQIGKAVRRVNDAYPSLEHEDLMQEAKALVLSYAGVIKGRHNGILHIWEDKAQWDENQVRGYLGYELRLDLLELVGPAEERRINTLSMDVMPLNRHPSYSPEETWISKISLEEHVRKTYPYLALRVYDQLTVQEMARRLGIGHATVERRLAVEKAAAAKDPIFTGMTKGNVRLAA